MPSSIVHLCVGKVVNKNLRMNEYELLLGAIAPDSWRNNAKNFSRSITHFTTFNSDFSIKNEEGIDNFFTKYKDYFDNPFVVGYFIHLLTDTYWRKNVSNVYSSIIKNARLPIILEKKDKFNNYSRDDFYDDEHQLFYNLSKYYRIKKLEYNKVISETISEISLNNFEYSIQYINSMYFHKWKNSVDIYDFDKTIFYIEECSIYIVNQLNLLFQSTNKKITQG